MPDDVTSWHRLPDGTRVRGESFALHVYCQRCTRPSFTVDRYWPEEFIILCGHPYCWDCFPKAVAVLEADVIATELLFHSKEMFDPKFRKPQAAIDARARMSAPLPPANPPA